MQSKPIFYCTLVFIFLFIATCKKNDQNQNKMDNSMVAGKVVLPQGSQINSSDLRVISIMEEVTVNGDTYKMDSSSFRSYTTQVVLNGAGNPIMMRYNYPNNPNNDISAQTTVLTMLMDAPAIQSLTNQAKINLISSIEKLPEFSTCANEVTKNLIIGRSFIDSTNTNLITSFQSLIKTASTLRTQGVLDEPILINVGGNRVTFTNNGVAVNYWIGIYKNGQKMILSPISAAQLFATSSKNLFEGIFGSGSTPSSTSYTFPSDGEYKVFIRSGRDFDNTSESQAALVQNLTYSALDVISAFYPKDFACTQAVINALKTHIETSFSLYVMNNPSSSDLTEILIKILKATYSTFNLKDCVKDEKIAQNFFVPIFQYLDFIRRIGGVLNGGAFLIHFVAARSVIDTCFKVSNGVAKSCNSANDLTGTWVGSYTGKTWPFYNPPYCPHYTLQSWTIPPCTAPLKLVILDIGGNQITGTWAADQNVNGGGNVAPQPFSGTIDGNTITTSLFCKTKAVMTFTGMGIGSKMGGAMEAKYLPDGTLLCDEVSFQLTKIN